MYDLQNRLSQQNQGRPSRPVRRSFQSYGYEPDWHGGTTTKVRSSLDVSLALQPSSSSQVPFTSMILAHLERDQLQAARKLLSIAQEQETGSQALALLARLLAPPGVKVGPTASGGNPVTFPTVVALDTFRGQWVAIAAGKVIGHAPALKTLMEELKNQSNSDRPVLHLVPR